MLITIGKNTSKNMAIMGLTDYPFTEQQLKTQYRDLAKKWHPDLNKEEKAAEEFRKVNEAYSFLINLSMSAPENEMLVEVQDNDIFAIYETCTHCQGRGWTLTTRTDFSKSYYETIICSGCSDKCKKCDNGVFTLRSGRKVPCKSCNGTGIFTFRRGFCFSCFNARRLGYTRYHEVEEKITCGHCKGAGKTKLDLFNPVIPAGAILT